MSGAELQLRARLIWNRLRWRIRSNADTLSMNRGGWGNHIARLRPEDSIWDPRLTVWGHRPRPPKTGDRVTIEMESGQLLEGAFELTKLCTDPRDMFFGRVHWHGYVTPGAAP